MTVNIQKEYWNSIYQKYNPEKPQYDLWLEKYGDILQMAGESRIIDLGCGWGNNSLYLSERGHRVLACDISQAAVDKLKVFVPEAETMVLDMKEGLPFENESAVIIIADLTLHYFYWKDTVNIIEDIRRVLIPGGYLLCRLNSTKDVHHGAGQGALLEGNYYAVNGNLKRFFDREQIERLFEGWRFRHMDEYQMNRYNHPKILWEAAVEKVK